MSIPLTEGQVEITEVERGYTPEGVNAFREVELDGVKYVINRYDPYGLWRIEMDPLPERLDQQFTSDRLAVETLKIYLDGEKVRKETEAKAAADKDAKMAALQAKIDKQVAGTNRLT
jgi:hypothetical protein